MRTYVPPLATPVLLLALVLLLLPPGSAAAQERAEGAFQRSHSEASALLNAFHANRAAVFAGLENASGGQLPNGFYAQLVTNLENAPARAARGGGMGRSADEVVTRARALHQQILNIYTAADIDDRRVAAEQAIDTYLASAGTALPAQPKDREIVVALTGGQIPTADAEHADHADHAGRSPDAHTVHGPMDPASAGTFGGRHPQINRLLWAQQWLEIAMFEPILRAASADAQAEGMREVITRFRARLADPEGPRLSVMPTTPAISPELTMRHPRAAAILDNLFLLETALLNDLASGTAADRPARIERTVAMFTDPSQHSVDEYDWLVESLRMSVFLQGGPALGTMERLDRNVGSLGDHRIRGDHPIMPGS